MKVVPRSKIPPSMRQAMPTFGQHRAAVKAQRLDKMVKEQRKLKAAQATADPEIQQTIQQRSDLLGRRMDRHFAQDKEEEQPTNSA